MPIQLELPPRLAEDLVPWWATVVPALTSAAVFGGLALSRQGLGAVLLCLLALLSATTSVAVPTWQRRRRRAAHAAATSSWRARVRRLQASAAAEGAQQRLDGALTVPGVLGLLAMHEAGAPLPQRGPEDPGHSAVLLGIGSVPAREPLQLAEAGRDHCDPHLLAEALTAVEQSEFVEGAAVALDLASSAVFIRGSGELPHLVAEGLRSQAVATCRPGSLAVAVLALSDQPSGGFPAGSLVKVPTGHRAPLVSDPRAEAVWIDVASAASATLRRNGRPPWTVQLEQTSERQHEQLLALRASPVSAGADSPFAERPGCAVNPLVAQLGHDPRGIGVRIDLDEAAFGGHGPHALVVGATGTGKSELLRTWIAQLTERCTPQEVAVLLVDFKGGSALSAFAELPHCAGLVTNLAHDAVLVTRFETSLRAELTRRQEVLAQHRTRSWRELAVGAGLAAPRLVVVVDETAELLVAHPGVAEVLTAVARLGRALGVHLILGSQRIDDPGMRALDPHMRIRISLRVPTLADSAAVVGDGSAAGPAAPGAAVVAVDGVRQAFTVSRCPESPLPRPGARTPLVWHPTLPDQLNPADLEHHLGQTPDGLTSAEGADAVVGLLDVPHQQRVDLLKLPLLDPSEHLLVVGGSTQERQQLVAALCGAAEPGSMRVDGSVRVDASLRAVVLDASNPVQAGTALRRLSFRAAQGIPCGRLLVVVADPAALRRRCSEVDEALLCLAQSGHEVGVQLVVLAPRWSDVRPSLLESVPRRWELALADQSTSPLPAGRRPPAHRPPGRVLTQEGLWAQLVSNEPGPCPPVPGWLQPLSDEQAPSGITAAIAGGQPESTTGWPPTHAGELGVSDLDGDIRCIRAGAGASAAVVGDDRRIRLGVLNTLVGVGFASRADGSGPDSLADPRVVRPGDDLALGEVLLVADLAALSPGDRAELERALGSDLERRAAEGQQPLALAVGVGASWVRRNSYDSCWSLIRSSVSDLVLLAEPRPGPPLVDRWAAPVGRTGRALLITPERGPELLALRPPDPPRHELGRAQVQRLGAGSVSAAACC